MNDLKFHDYLQLARLLVNKMNEQLTKNELYHSQWLIINYLYNYDSATLVEIANYLHVEKSAITRTVNRLEEHKLVLPVSGKDKRERRIALTEKGKESYILGRNIVDEIELNALKNISSTEQEQFFTTLNKIKNNVHQQGR
ncbi:hypothetical protein BIV60_02330 [Bacillus sp. MUM 116]|nr:hypothetical protein BIV60_02330 [Bacillus sp. MUM 116]